VSKFTVEDLTSGFRAIKSGVAHNLLYLLPNTYSYPTYLNPRCLKKWKKREIYLNRNPGPAKGERARFGFSETG